MEAPDPRDIVRSLPQHVQRRLRRRTKINTKVRDRDDNVVDEDVTDSDEGTIRKRRGRPKRKVPELYSSLIEHPSGHFILEAPLDH